MTTSRVNEIDLLRFISALSVVFFHYAFWGHTADAMSIMPYPLLASVSKYGWLGVLLFFMISGFVILMTAASGSLRGFVISRIVRLYPAFWACCTITFVAIVVLGTPRYSASVGQYLINMTMLSNFLYVEAIDGVYWSLGVELRFYALVAMVLLVGKIHQTELFIFFWLMASVVLEFVRIGSVYYLLVADYSAFFIAGAAYFLIWSKGVSLTRIAIVVVSWGLAILQTRKRLEWFETDYNIIMSSQIVLTVVTIFFVAMMLISLKRTGLLADIHWPVVGALTYPLYLLHQNMGYIVFNAAYPKANEHLIFWGTAIFVLASAYAVHIFVEKPFSSPFKCALNRFADNVQRLTSRFSGSAGVHH
jgi:peptidoglycan/LPS O-acetylase OafA/YrhL